ncbi:MAG: hypothetical protein OFPII_22760 [Osedax symbiont Rs1]|nr:MAG: hypothetical protein OFPII_22760 [Osedax symbiont Rs1]
MLLSLSLSFFTSCYLYANFAASLLELPSLLFVVDSYQVLLKWMIIPYASSLLCYCAFFLLFKKIVDLRRLLAKLSWAVLIASSVFLLYPLKFSQPFPQLDGLLFTQAFSLLHGIDQPYNQAPSLHVIFAVIFYSEIVKLTRNTTLRAISRAWFALIIVSTWFTLQHHSIDIISGLAVGVTINLLIKHSAHYASSLYLMAGGLSMLAMHFLADKCYPAMVMMAYLATSLLATSLVYSFNEPRWLGKRSGRLSIYRGLLFAPYLLGYQLTWWLNNRYFPNSQRLTKVTEQLWLGPKLKPALVTLLPAEVSVFDLTAELNEQPSLLTGQYQNFPLLDLQAPSAGQLASIMSSLLAQLKSQAQVDGTPLASRSTPVVYLHCAMGYSRCYLLACLYLMIDRGYSPSRARQYLTALGGSVKLGAQYLSDNQLLAIAERCKRAALELNNVT